METKYVNTLLHALLVGVIASLAIVVSSVLGVKAWIVFFAWANYFLHSCNLKKSIVMMGAFFVGIFLALIGNYAIEYLNASALGVEGIIVVAFVVFCMATLLVFLEVVESWKEFVPATFLGTVLFYSSGVTSSTIVTELSVPLLVGVVAGFVTVYSRNKLSMLLSKK